MDFLRCYIDAIANLQEQIYYAERDRIEQAAEKMAETYINGNLIHIFGTGTHASMAGEELFLRPGSLMNISPIFDPGLSVVHGAYRSWMIEDLTGYAKPVLDYYHIEAGDTILIINAYGINSVTIDAAIESKKKGATVIAISSKSYAEAVDQQSPSRHPSGKNLNELDSIDVFIDSHVPAGDCVIGLPGSNQKLGPVSTLCNCIILGMLNAAAVIKLERKGIEPETIKDPNFFKDGLQNNIMMINKYYERIKHI